MMNAEMLLAAENRCRRLGWEIPDMGCHVTSYVLLANIPKRWERAGFSVITHKHFLASDDHIHTAITRTVFDRPNDDWRPRRPGHPAWADLVDRLIYELIGHATHVLAVRENLNLYDTGRVQVLARYATVRA